MTGVTLDDMPAEIARRDEDRAPERARLRRKPARGDRMRFRIRLAVGVFALAFAVIIGRLVMLGVMEPPAGGAGADRQRRRSPPAGRTSSTATARCSPTDIKTASLYAEPRNIVDPDEAAEADRQRAARPRRRARSGKRLTGDAGFVWIKREITPKQQQKIHALGIPGHRLPHREPALLSRRPDRRAYPRPGQCRQPGHRRHREIRRRPVARRPARRRLRPRRGARAGQAVDRPPRPAHPARRTGPGDGALPRDRRRRRRAQRPDRRGRRDGLAARLRPEQSGRCAQAGPAQPHDGRRLRAGLDLQELHLRHGARLRRGDAERQHRRERGRSASAASPSTTSTASTAC